MSMNLLFGKKIHWIFSTIALGKNMQKNQLIEILFQPFEIPTIKIGKNTS